MPGYLKIDSMQIAGMCECVCLLPRQLITSGMMWHDINSYSWLNKLYSCYMATLAIIVNGHALGFNMHRGN